MITLFLFFLFIFDTHFIGQYPWIAALGYHFPNISTNGLQFYCAGSLVIAFFNSKLHNRVLKKVIFLRNR